MAPGSAQAATLEQNVASGISSQPSCQAFSDHPVGSACFHADGDYFYISDYSGPGKVAVYWKLADGSRHGIIRWAATEQYTRGVENKNFIEGKQIGIRFGVCMNSACDRVADLNFQGSSWSWTSA